MALGQNKTGGLAALSWLLWIAGVAVAILVIKPLIFRGDPIPVRVTNVKRVTIRSVVTTNGKIEPLQSFEAHAPIGTIIKAIFVKEGDAVKRGQLLVQMDDAEAREQAARALAQVKGSEATNIAVRSGGNQEEVLTLQSDLAKARTSYETAVRNRDALLRLQQNGAASPAEVFAAEEQVKLSDDDVKLLEQKQKDRYSAPEISRVEAQRGESRSAYAAAQDLLNQLNVRAPFDGIVYSLPVHRGAYLNAGDLILQEADLSKVLVRAYVDEPDVARLRPGQHIDVTWDAMPNQAWECSLDAVPTTLRLHGTRNVGETTCMVNNADRKLLPNTNVGVAIITAENKNVLAVPREAVRQDDGTPYLLQVVNDKLERRDVETSIANLTQVEVTRGVDDGAVVAVASTNSKPLHPGATVKVVR